MQLQKSGTLGDTIAPQVYTDETGFSVVLKDAESSTVFATVRLEVTCRGETVNVAAAIFYKDNKILAACKSRFG